jgi:hypothetical protein
VLNYNRYRYRLDAASSATGVQRTCTQHTKVAKAVSSNATTSNHTISNRAIAQPQVVAGRPLSVLSSLGGVPSLQVNRCAVMETSTAYLATDLPNQASMCLSINVQGTGRSTLLQAASLTRAQDLQQHVTTPDSCLCVVQAWPHDTATAQQPPAARLAGSSVRHS